MVFISLKYLNKFYTLACYNYYLKQKLGFQMQIPDSAPNLRLAERVSGLSRGNSNFVAEKNALLQDIFLNLDSLMEEDKLSLQQLKEKVIVQTDPDAWATSLMFELIEKETIKKFFEIDDSQKVSYFKTLLQDSNPLFIPWFINKGYHKITDSKVRFEIIKLLIPYSFEEIMSDLAALKLDHSQTVEFAKICAAISAESVFIRMDWSKFAENELVEVALIAAKRDGKTTLHHTGRIPNFNSLPQNDKFRIIQVALEQNLESFASVYNQGLYFEHERSHPTYGLPGISFACRTDEIHTRTLAQRNTKIIASLKPVIEIFDDYEALKKRIPPINRKIFEEVGSSSSSIRKVIEVFIKKYGLEEKVKLSLSEVLEEKIPDFFVYLRSLLPILPAHDFGILIESYKIACELEKKGPIQIDPKLIIDKVEYMNGEYSFNSLRDHLQILLLLQSQAPSQERFNPKNVLSEIEKIEDDYVKNQALIWLSATIFTLACNNIKETWITEENILSSLVNIPVPELRFPLSLNVMQIAQSKHAKTLSDELLQQSRRVHREAGRTKAIPEIHSYLPIVLSSMWDSFAKEGKLSEEQFKEINAGCYLPALHNFITTIETTGYQVFRDTRKFLKLLNTLHLLKNSTSLTSHEKINVLNHLAACKTGKEMVNEIDSMIVLFNISRDDQLKNTKNSYQELIKKSFQEILPLGKIDNFSVRYAKTFGSSRIPDAIIIYAASLKKNHNMTCMKALGEFVTEVCNDEFIKNRYIWADGKNSHLEQLFQNDSVLLENWKKAVPSFTISNSGIVDEKGFDYKPWMVTKLMNDHHINLYQFEFLKQVLEGKIDPAKGIILIAEEERKLPKDTELATLLFQKQCLRLMTEIAKDEQIKLLKFMQNFLIKQAPCEFVNDIKGIIQTLSTVEEETLYTVVETDDPYDLALCGTEVPGSCQRIDGSFHNQGLLGYLKDGKNRLVAIKNKKSGKIVARCIIRLALEKVLFVERIYPQPTSTVMTNALKEMCIRKAKQLGVPLACNQDSYKISAGTPLGKSLTFAQGNAPFDYSDAANGLMPGAFEIKNPLLIFDPNT